jgi:Zn-finger nucleic acid-binding protein
MPKCPICKTAPLHPTYYEDNLPVSECSSCGGAWLRANEYSLWLKTQAPTRPNAAGESITRPMPITESHQAGICPDCGHFLRKYEVAANFSFHLDRCNNCNGVWLDQNEWQALKAAGLHDEINQVFTKPWQQHIQAELTAQKLDANYLEKFGEEDYEKIKGIRAWLAEHPQRNPLLAFLLDKDPYST